MSARFQTTIIFFVFACLFVISDSACPLHCIQCFNQQCTYCAQSYALTTDGLCMKSTVEGCAVFKSATQCVLCKPGLILQSNFCVQDSSGCIQRNLITRVCSKCSYGKFLALGTCFGILHCKKYQGSKCQKCFDGFKVKVTQNYTKCQPDLLNQNSHCLQISVQNEHCQKCVQGYQKKGLICVPKERLNSRCEIYDQTYHCISCQIGLQLYQNECVTQQQVKLKILLKIKSVPNNSSTKNDYVWYQSFIDSGQNKQSNSFVVRGLNFGGSSSYSDSGCFYALTNGTCLKCLKQYQLVGGYCIIPNCIKIIDHQCKGCKQQFQLKDRKCISKVSVTTGLAEKREQKQNAGLRNMQLCKVLNLIGQCTKCIQGYFPKDGYCVQFYQRCKTSSPANGKCLSCYDGYRLINQDCIQQQSDINCKKFVNGKCEQCSDRFFLQFGTGVCLPVDQNCKDYHIFTGKCRQCYEGYKVQNGMCIVITDFSPDVKLTSKQPIQKQKQQIAKQNQVSNAFKNSPNKSSSIGSMVQANYNNVNCKTIEKQTGKCVQCYQGYFLKNGVQCTMLDSLCKTHNLIDGQCLSCWQGYILAQGKCILETKSAQNSEKKQNNPNLTVQTQNQKTSSKNIQNCKKINNGVCQQCSFGFYLQNTPQRLINKCLQIDPLCKKFNLEAKKCVQCYEGYQISQIQQVKCVIKPIKNIDPFCQIYDQVSKKCLRCIQRYFLSSKIQDQAKCEPVSIVCKGYYQDTGKCKSCIQGHVLQQGQCLRPSLGVDQNCVFYEIGYCSKCKQGFQLKEYKCVTINTGK